MRLTIDTSAVVSSLRSKTGAAAQVVRMGLAGQFDWLMSVALLPEYEDVLSRPVHRAATFMTSEDVEVFLNNILQLHAAFAGRRYDTHLLADFPPHVEPCGERGEFHSFVCPGPMFAHRIAIRSGETVARDGFLYADFLPETASTAAA